jgi:coenzyme F420-0:L-glutamate ligase/coenzyme F420-1:gamma-L-glutamate ligase
VLPVDGVPEVRAGDDLVRLLLAALPEPLQDGDIVVMSSKVVAKADGLAVRIPRETVIEEHTDRVVAVRGSMQVVRLASGLTLAAAGVDESNTDPGTVVPLPSNPDESARVLRARLHDVTGHQLAVVVTDTAGRPWRAGQTDLAVGAAGLVPLLDLAGTDDANGSPLRVTAPAIADEVAAAADLVRGKALGRPFAVVRGLGHLTTTDAGPGAQALVRSEDDDLFGLGSRDAVRAAVRCDDPYSSRGFPAPGAMRSWLPGLLEDAAARLDPQRVRLELVPGHQSDAGATARVVVAVRGHTPHEQARGGPVDLQAALDAGALAERVRILAAARRAQVTVEPALDTAIVHSGWRAVQVLRIAAASAGDG